MDLKASVMQHTPGGWFLGASKLHSPIQALIQALAPNGDRALHMPFPIFQSRHAERLADLCR